MVVVIWEVEIIGPIKAEDARSLKTLCENLGRKVNVVMNRSIQPELMMPDNKICVVSRIIQESVTNAIRHGNAKRIDINLAASKTRFELLIKDDGVGFNQTLPTAGTGILSMRERAASLPGGTFSIEAAVGRGTAISIKWGEQLGEA